MNTVKRFRFIPAWKIEKTEQWLSDMEADGYRLEKITFLRLIYHFKSSRPRKTNYFFTYQRQKGSDMSLIAHGLMQKYSANEIENKFSTFALYRITADCDLTFEKESRLVYFRSAILESLLISCLPLLIPIFLCLYGQFVRALVCALLTLPAILFNLYGLCRQTAKIRAYHNRKWNNHE